MTSFHGVLAALVLALATSCGAPSSQLASTKDSATIDLESELLSSLRGQVDQVRLGTNSLSQAASDLDAAGSAAQRRAELATVLRQVRDQSNTLEAAIQAMVVKLQHPDASSSTARVIHVATSDFEGQIAALSAIEQNRLPDLGAQIADYVSKIDTNDAHVSDYQAIVASVGSIVADLGTVLNTFDRWMNGGGDGSGDGGNDDGGSDGRGDQPVAVAADVGVVIPDNNTNGVTVPVYFDPQGTIDDVSVALTFQGGAPGDLTAALIHPDGTRIQLAAQGTIRAGQITFGSGGTAVPALSSLNGKNFHGTWKLFVADVAAQDVATFSHYQITVQTHDQRPSDTRVVSLPQTANQLVPDNNTTGILRDVVVGDSGAIDTVSLHLELQGGVPADLAVSLITPAGTELTLASRNLTALNFIIGEGGIDAVSLAGLVGASVHGRWTVRVSDLAAQDVSTLVNLTLSFRVHGGSAARPDQVLTVDQAFNAVIPDNNTTGVTMSFFIGDQGTIDDVAARVLLTGGVPADLAVDLIHPDGTRVSLAARNLTSLDTSFGNGGVSVRGLDALAGKPLRGSWQLYVADLAAQDVSTLTHLTLSLRRRQ